MLGSRVPRAVLLDAAGTLITVARPVGETYALLTRELGGDLDAATLTTRFRAAFPTMPPLAFPGRWGADLEHAEREWWRTLVRYVVGAAGDALEFDTCFDRLYAHYASSEAWQVYPEVTAALTALRGRGAALAVVSNFDSRLPPLLDAMGLATFFDTVVCSGETGAAKPDPAIFAQALASLGVAATDALHVGDDRRCDYDGARAAGLEALLLDRRATTTGPETIVDLHAIPDRW